MSTIFKSVSTAVNLPTTAANATTGVLLQNSVPLLQTFGTDNLFFGPGAGNFTLSGVSNTALGPGALPVLTTGNQNIGIAKNAGFKLTTGSANILAGFSTGSELTTGSNNVFIGGDSTGQLVDTCNFCTFIGSTTDSSGDSGIVNSAALGANASVPDSNWIQLGDTGITVVNTSGQVRCASLAVANSAAATTPGAVTKKIQVFDSAGASLGYIAVYASIT